MHHNNNRAAEREVGHLRRAHAPLSWHNANVYRRRADSGMGHATACEYSVRVHGKQQIIGTI